MSDEESKWSNHPAIHWFFLKWPKWVKITTAAVGILSLIGTVMGFGGQIINAIHAHDTGVQVATAAKILDQQHDAKVDQTLEEHGKAITDVRAGVQDIQNHLSKQDVEVLASKGQLDRIETAIISGNTPHVSLPTTTPHP